MSRFTQSIAMNIIRHFYFILLLMPFTACAQSAKPNIGGPCEGCEAINESPVPMDRLPFRDTIAAYHSAGTKLHLRGTVYKPDGKTPAAGVIVYLYHTDENGVYPTSGNEKGWGKRHGYLRTWLKTDEKGAYELFTIRPGSYPNSNNPQHIHMTVKEPGKNEYWIDEIHFTDDPFLTQQVISHFQDRGGSGIITLSKNGNIYSGERNIILGKNVPGYY